VYDDRGDTELRRGIDRVAAGRVPAEHAAAAAATTDCATGFVDGTCVDGTDHAGTSAADHARERSSGSPRWRCM
jgi:hypothetical protein